MSDSRREAFCQVGGACPILRLAMVSAAGGQCIAGAERSAVLILCGVLS